MDTQTLLGSWISVGSEIPGHRLGTDIYHFCEPDRLLVEFYRDEGSSQVSMYRFAVTQDGFRYGSHESKPYEVVAWIEGGHMIWRPVHGMETWFSRATPDSLPEWVRGLELMKAKMPTPPPEDR
jgi:hypothetical protein